MAFRRGQLTPIPGRFLNGGGPPHRDFLNCDGVNVEFMRLAEAVEKPERNGIARRIWAAMRHAF
jgi:hypothetical protein